MGHWRRKRKQVSPVRRCGWLILCSCLPATSVCSSRSQPTNEGCGRNLLLLSLSFFVHFSVTMSKLSAEWCEVEVFSSGGESIYGYDSVNPSLLVSSSDGSRTSRLHFSSNPSWPIRRLILNSNETLVALLADRLSYLVQLPSPSSRSSLCSILRVAPASKSSGSVLDFLWLSVDEFLLLYSSSFDLFSLRSFRPESLERCQSFAIGPVSSSKKSISLHQPSDILRLALLRGDPLELLVLKSDGEIYFFDRETSDGQRPVRMLPSTFNNYGSDHQQSLLLSLVDSPIVLLTRDRRQLDQCLLLRTAADDVVLYRIDSLVLPDEQRIVSIVPHRSSSERYFLLDSGGNVYSVRISWLDQIEDEEKRLRPTLVEHLIHNSLSSNRIEHLASLDNSLLLVILQQNKVTSSSSLSARLLLVVQELLRLDSGRSLVPRLRSIPQLTFSSSSPLSNADLEKNLSIFVQIFSEEYLQKQERMQREIEEKQIVLGKLRQTQLNEYRRLQERFAKVNGEYRALVQRSDQVSSFFLSFFLGR